MWTTSTHTPPYPLPQRSSVSFIDHFLFGNITRYLAAQLPPSLPPPVLPTRQATNETTPLFSHSSAQPRHHTMTGPHAHNLMLGHHRHEAPQQHERHYV